MNMENTYAIIENELVVNLAVADAEFAQEQGWVLATPDVRIGWKYIDGQFIPYTPQPDYTKEQIIAINTSTAQNLLYNTDWSQYPDVVNTLNNPHLLNQDEFTLFRENARQVLINPPETLVTFPPVPAAIWSGIVENKEMEIVRV